MRMRPADGSGDMLPVLSSSGMVSGAAAVALLAEDRLKLLSGDWWENPAWGCEILRMLQEGRLTEADGPGISLYLSGYVRETPGVREVRNEKWSLSGGQLQWSCDAVTEYGMAEVRLVTGT